MKDSKLFKPSGVLAVIAEALLLLVEAGFVGLLMKVDLLPIKFMALVILALVCVDVLVAWLLGGRRSNRNLVGLIISLVIMCILVFGGSYLMSTYSAFNEITTVTTQYDEYDVVVLDGSAFKNVESLDGQKVSIARANLKTYNEAQGKLKSMAEVTYEEKDDISQVGDVLMPSSDQKIQSAAKSGEHQPVILISKDNYRMLCKERKGFKKNTRVLKKIMVEVKKNNDASSIEVTEDSFNIYVSGIDIWGSIHGHKSRSDVNMIVTINPKTRQILLTSIPRDAYVRLHSFGQVDKLTHAGIYDDGISETVATVEDWLDIKMDYNVRANFDMVVKLVNAMDGIDVYSDYAFKSWISDYEYKEGYNHMKGRQALYFARERKSFKDMDQQRIKNQQKVVKAVMKKMFKSKVLLTNYGDIMKAISSNMETSMSNEDISKLVKMQLNEMKEPWRINSISIEGTMDKKGTYSMGLARPLDVCVINEDSLERAKTLINEVMYPPEDKKIKIHNDKSKNGLKDNLDQIRPN